DVDSKEKRSCEECLRGGEVEQNDAIVKGVERCRFVGIEQVYGQFPMTDPPGRPTEVAKMLCRVGSLPALVIERGKGTSQCIAHGIENCPVADHLKKC